MNLQVGLLVPPKENPQKTRPNGYVGPTVTPTVHGQNPAPQGLLEFAVESIPKPLVCWKRISSIQCQLVEAPRKWRMIGRLAPLLPLCSWGLVCNPFERN